uniref:Serpentine Receptor, class T n=1 Tax=Caenorhabditis tropicalis TaxID=1561998 RepID=A0A1I7TXP8_9PELO
MYLFIHTIQYSSFILSQITNSLLLWLIYKKAAHLLGPFRYLMSSFSIFSMLYSYVDIIAQPLVLIEKQMFVVINHGPLRYTDWFGFVAVCLLGALFGLCIAFLCSEFIFRYIIICKPKYREYIDGPRLLFLFIVPSIISVPWFFFCYFGLIITPEKKEILRIPFKQNYEEDSEKLMFVGGLYWSIGRDGSREWCIRDCLASLGLTGLMVICCSTILFCGVKTYRKMKEVQSSLSKQTAALNNQLFTTLTLQVGIHSKQT